MAIVSECLAGVASEGSWKDRGMYVEWGHPVQCHQSGSGLHKSWFGGPGQAWSSSEDERLLNTNHEF